MYDGSHNKNTVNKNVFSIGALHILNHFMIKAHSAPLLRWFFSSSKLKIRPVNLAVMHFISKSLLSDHCFEFQIVLTTASVLIAIVVSLTAPPTATKNMLIISDKRTALR